MSDLEGILISKHGPLVIGRGVDSISVSSDVQPFYGVRSEVAYLNDGDTFLLTREKESNQMIFYPFRI